MTVSETLSGALNWSGGEGWTLWVSGNPDIERSVS